VLKVSFIDEKQVSEFGAGMVSGAFISLVSKKKITEENDALQITFLLLRCFLLYINIINRFIILFKIKICFGQAPNTSMYGKLIYDPLFDLLPDKGSYIGLPYVEVFGP